MQNATIKQKLVMIAATLFALIGEARAEVVTLVCGAYGKSNVARIEIDVTNQRIVCESFFGGGCGQFNAQITDRSITFGGNNKIDRATGNIYWASGEIDSCHRASGDILR